MRRQCRHGVQACVRLNPLAAVAGAVLALLTGSAQAVLPADAEIIELLRSPIAIEVAWGGYWAAEVRHAALLPDLLRALESQGSGPPVDRQLATTQVLDALIRLDAAVPAGVVRTFYDRWPVQALLLWKQQTPERDAILIPLLREAQNDYWFALANLLLETRPAGAAETILGAPVALHVNVTDPGVMAEWSGVIGGVVGGVDEPTSPYPPVPGYVLASTGSDRAVLTAGPRSVTYRRVLEPGWFDRRSTTMSGPSPADRATYFAALAGATMRVSPVVSMPWVDAADLAPKAHAAALALRTEYERIVALLVRHSLVDAADAARLFETIEIRLYDLRAASRTPLPAIAPLRRAPGRLR